MPCHAAAERPFALLVASARPVGEALKAGADDDQECVWGSYVPEDDRVIVRISGRVGAKNLDVLQSVLEEGRIAAIDLKDILLIDEDAVKLLIAAQANGIELRNRTAYILNG